MMLDADVVAVSPSSVYRVLKRRRAAASGTTASRHSKGKGFVQPLRPHEHWHVDVSYLNIAGTFYYLCSLLDGCSRFIVHWEIRETMTEADVETIIQRARERYPDATPADHLRQRAAVHRQGLQGVHPALRHDPRADLALLPAEQRQDRALAPDAQGRVHPPRRRRCRWRTPGGSWQGYVRHYNTVPLAQRHRLRHARGQAGRPRARRSSPSGTASWRRPVRRGGSSVRR